MIQPKRFKKYFTGGELQMAMQAAEIGNQLTNTVVGNVAKTNEYGNVSAEWEGLKGGIQGGPIGALIGYQKGKSILQQDERRRFQEKSFKEQEQAGRTAAVMSSNPSLFSGNGTAMYRSGGSLNTVSLPGGSATQLGNNSIEINGPSHEQGGVDLPAAAANLEGKETIANGYVFSKELGFAKVHKPIAKAIGRIEAKPLTKDRINSLKNLKAREVSLMETQEQLKTLLNIQ